MVTLVLVFVWLVVLQRWVMKRQKSLHAVLEERHQITIENGPGGSWRVAGSATPLSGFARVKLEATLFLRQSVIWGAFVLALLGGVAVLGGVLSLVLG